MSTLFANTAHTDTASIFKEIQVASGKISGKRFLSPNKQSPRTKCGDFVSNLNLQRELFIFSGGLLSSCPGPPSQPSSQCAIRGTINRFMSYTSFQIKIATQLLMHNTKSIIFLNIISISYFTIPQPHLPEVFHSNGVFGVKERQNSDMPFISQSRSLYGDFRQAPGQACYT